MHVDYKVAFYRDLGTITNVTYVSFRKLFFLSGIIDNVGGNVPRIHQKTFKMLTCTFCMTKQYWELSLRATIASVKWHSFWSGVLGQPVFFNQLGVFRRACGWPVRWLVMRSVSRNRFHWRGGFTHGPVLSVGDMCAYVVAGGWVVFFLSPVFGVFFCWPCVMLQVVYWITSVNVSQVLSEVVSRILKQQII